MRRTLRCRLLTENAYQTLTDTVIRPTHTSIRQESQSHDEAKEEPIKEPSPFMEELGSASHRENQHRGFSWWRRVFHGRKRRLSRKTRVRLSLPNLNLADPWFRGSSSEDSGEEAVYVRMEEDDDVEEEMSEFEEEVEESMKSERGKTKWWRGAARWKK